MDGTFVPTEPDPEPVAVCAICDGRGYLRRDVPIGHPDFGTVVACQCREPQLRAARIERAFGRAEIPDRLRYRTFDSYRLLPGADLEACAAVESWAARTDRASLYLHGGYGVGKTSLAYAAFRHRLETTQCDGLFKTSPALLEAVRKTFDRETGTATSSDVTDAAAGATLLLLDDLGAEKTSDWVEERLYLVMNERYNAGRATIITSNYTIAQLAPRIGQRIPWRIVEMADAHVVHVKGKNHRDR